MRLVSLLCPFVVAMMLSPYAHLPGAEPRAEDFTLEIEQVAGETTAVVIGRWPTVGSPALGDGVVGWSWGICHNPEEVSVGDCEPVLGSGLDCPAVSLPGEMQGFRVQFMSVSIYANGISQAVILDISNRIEIDSRDRFEMLRVQYDLKGDRCFAPLEFCRALGIPPVDINMTVGGLSAMPVIPAVRKGIFLRRPLTSGDTNADGAVDISDAIRILSSLFLGGPDPVALERWPCFDIAAQMPATGQKKCYDGFGGEIPCGASVFPGQDGDHQTGCDSTGRFVDNGDGTITDRCTRLMWQKASAGQRTWQEALLYCDGLDLAGHNDWRLPSIRELTSLLDYGNPASAIDAAFVVAPGFHWSSTTSAADPLEAWNVTFREWGEWHPATMADSLKTTALNVLAVRTICATDR